MCVFKVKLKAGILIDAYIKKYGDGFTGIQDRKIVPLLRFGAVDRGWCGWYSRRDGYGKNNGIYCMNKCIYFKEDNLKYDSREHIFPAGIGGVKRLLRGFVSDKANNYFSNIER